MYEYNTYEDKLYTYIIVSITNICIIVTKLKI